MEVGIVGLGKMGGSMARRLLRGGHLCVVRDRHPENVRPVVQEGGKEASTIAELVSLLKAPRVVWLMVSAGQPTESAIEELYGLLEPGDVVIDGGNSDYRHDARRAAFLSKKSIGYMDVGTSGGVWGLTRGYCLMIGGKQADFLHCEPLFSTLAPSNESQSGYLYCGPSGAGHFVKMVHNGIEYGMMQALAEGFELMKEAAFSDSEGRAQRLNLPQVAEVWRQGSVVSSWLLDLTARALQEDGELAGFEGKVGDSGEGRWTVETAIQMGVSLPVISASVFARFRSQKDHTFGEKLLSAMRYQFGGHQERK